MSGKILPWLLALLLAGLARAGTNQVGGVNNFTNLVGDAIIVKSNATVQLGGVSRSTWPQATNTTIIITNTPPITTNFAGMYFVGSTFGTNVALGTGATILGSWVIPQSNNFNLVNLTFGTLLEVDNGINPTYTVVLTYNGAAIWSNDFRVNGRYAGTVVGSTNIVPEQASNTLVSITANIDSSTNANVLAGLEFLNLTGLH